MNASGRIAGLLLPLRRVCSGGKLSQKELLLDGNGAGGAGAAGEEAERPRGPVAMPATIECSLCLEVPENPVRKHSHEARGGLPCIRATRALHSLLVRTRTPVGLFPGCCAAQKRANRVHTPCLCVQRPLYLSQAKRQPL
jgi:hypothetical protein